MYDFSKCQKEFSKGIISEDGLLQLQYAEMMDAAYSVGLMEYFLKALYQLLLRDKKLQVYNPKFGNITIRSEDEFKRWHLLVFNYDHWQEIAASSKTNLRTLDPELNDGKAFRDMYPAINYIAICGIGLSGAISLVVLLAWNLYGMKRLGEYAPRLMAFASISISVSVTATFFIFTNQWPEILNFTGSSNQSAKLFLIFFSLFMLGVIYVTFGKYFIDEPIGKLRDIEWKPVILSFLVALSIQLTLAFLPLFLI